MKRDPQEDRDYYSEEKAAAQVIARNLRRRLRARMKSAGIDQYSGDLYRRLRTSIKFRNFVFERISVSLAPYSFFVDKGVGRGHGVNERSSAIRAASRKEKPFIWEPVNESGEQIMREMSKINERFIEREVFEALQSDNPATQVNPSHG